MPTEQQKSGTPPKRSKHPGDPSAPVVFAAPPPARPTVVFDTYWRFAAERQRIFMKRFMGEVGPWTDDPILRQYRFTNAYRASDRVSQFLIRRVAYAGLQSPVETFFRIILCKLFNRTSTWQHLTERLGTPSWEDYDYEHYDQILTALLESGRAIYSPAYIMPAGRRTFGFRRKHRNHLKLLEMMMNDDVPARVADSLTLRAAFEIMRSYPLIGDFLAYQYVIDLNYSNLTAHSENEFVMPGPGARDGIRKCFVHSGGLSDADIIHRVCEHQEAEFESRGIDFPGLWGRPLQLIDCQNLFCEVDKYARVGHPDIQGISGRTRIKRRFRAPRSAISYWYPPKWGINRLITSEEARYNSE